MAKKQSRVNPERRTWMVAIGEVAIDASDLYWDQNTLQKGARWLANKMGETPYDEATDKKAKASAKRIGKAAAQFAKADASLTILWSHLKQALGLPPSIKVGDDCPF